MNERSSKLKEFKIVIANSKISGPNGLFEWGRARHTNLILTLKLKKKIFEKYKTFLG